ncbi:hypothetical protein HDV05_003446 [Chytridiales sp. JEL 0842]|nr:hypothetical protein HDV05_003446 [Chytridiales sp. JEL 0842]
MPSLAAIKAETALVNLVKTRSLIIGGTSGIGEALARRLALAGSHTTIVGRSQTAGEAIVKSIQDQNGKADFRQLDTSLMGNVKAFAEEFKAKEERLDYLVLSAGIAKYQGRVETVDQLDIKMALHYYTRQAMTHHLMPLLERTASDPANDVRVLNILGARTGYPVDMNDLELKKNFTVANCAAVTTFYSDLIVESFHKLHPNISFIHSYPGAVNTNISRGLPSYLRAPTNFLMNLLATKPADCAEVQFYNLVNSGYKKGWFLLSPKGEAYGKHKRHDELRKIVTEHTFEVINRDVLFKTKFKANIPDRLRLDIPNETHANYDDSCIHAQNVGKAMFAGFAAIGGGESSVYMEMCEKGRETALMRLLEHAAAKGANAVVMVQYDTQDIMPGMTEVLAAGTAVIVRPLELNVSTSLTSTKRKPLLKRRTSLAGAPGMLRTDGPWWTDASQRTLILRGVNVSGAAKLPILHRTTTTISNTEQSDAVEKSTDDGTVQVERSRTEDGRYCTKVTESKVMYTHIRDGFLTEEKPTKLLGVSPMYDASHLDAPIRRDDGSEVKLEERLSFVGRPFLAADADEHFGRLRRWGFNFLRLNVAWEGLEHAGPGIYDYEYMDYIVELLLKAKQYGFRVFIDPHQDVWSRHCGGSGAPGWTHKVAGLDIYQFASTHSALVHNMYPDPAKYPKMIWPTNYFKLATATMFTLFFGGNTFAPNAMAPDGKTTVQDFLQDHYCNAFAELAKRIQKTSGLEDDVVIGYDTLNEPSHGWIGVEDLNKLSEIQEMKNGETPTPFQCMLTGAGFEAEVERWEMTSLGPAKKGMVKVDPKGQSVWLPPFPLKEPVGPDSKIPNKDRRNCVWAEHGVWDPATQRCLKPDYFSKDPKTGRKIDFLVDFWKPFVRKITNTIRQVHSTAVMFIEPPVNEKPPLWSADDGDPTYRIAYAPHWYDGITLINKHFNRYYNVDYLNYKRGNYSNVAFAVKLGESGIRQCFKNQLTLMRREGLEYLGQHPCIMGEIGIPYDMDNRIAYRTGDYSAQEKALDTNMRAIESTLINCTLWNYVADNNHAWGDGWNGEDLSIFSRILPKKKDLKAAPMVTSSVSTVGGASAVKTLVDRDALPAGGHPSDMDAALESKANDMHSMSVLSGGRDTLAAEPDESSNATSHRPVSSKTPLIDPQEDTDEVTEDSVEAMEDGVTASPASPPGMLTIPSNDANAQFKGATASAVSFGQQSQIPVDESDLDIGGRALNAFTRPYPVLTPGTPLHYHFDMNASIFSYTFSHPVLRKRRRVKKSQKPAYAPAQQEGTARSTSVASPAKLATIASSATPSRVPMTIVTSPTFTDDGAGSSLPHAPPEPLRDSPVSRTSTTDPLTPGGGAESTAPLSPTATLKKKASMIIDTLKFKSSTPRPRQRFSWLHHSHKLSMPSLFSTFHTAPTSAGGLNPESLATETEIYIPGIHYPHQNDLEVWVSEGSFRLELTDQRLHWRCGCFDKLAQMEAEDDAFSGDESEMSDDGGETEIEDVTDDDVMIHTIVFRRKKEGQVPLELFGRQKRKEVKQERALASEELVEGSRTISSKALLMSAPTAEMKEGTAQNLTELTAKIFSQLQGLTFEEKQFLEGKEIDAVDREVYIGISVGPIVAGIVGVEKFCYDIYGDSVNVASRLQSLHVDHILTTEEFYKILPADQRKRWVSRGEYSVKGKGQLHVYSYVSNASTKPSNLTRKESCVNMDFEPLSALVVRQRNFEKAQEESDPNIAGKSGELRRPHEVGTRRPAPSRTPYSRNSITMMINRTNMANLSRNRLSGQFSNYDIKATGNGESKSQLSIPKDTSGPVVMVTSVDSIEKGIDCLIKMSKSEFQLEEGAQLDQSGSIQSVKMSTPHQRNTIERTGFFGPNPKLAASKNITDAAANSSPIDALLMELSKLSLMNIDELRTAVIEHIYLFSGRFKQTVVEEAYREKMLPILFRQNYHAVFYNALSTCFCVVLVILYENFIALQPSIMAQIVSTALACLQLVECFILKYVMELNAVVPFCQWKQKYPFLYLSSGAFGFAVSLVTYVSNIWFILAFTEFGRIPYVASPCLHSLVLFGSTLESTVLSFGFKKMMTWLFVAGISVQQVLQGRMAPLDLVNLAGVIMILTFSEYGLLMSRKIDFIVEQMIEKSRQKSDEEVKISAGLLSAILPSKTMNLLMDGVEAQSIVDTFLIISVLHLDICSFTQLSSTLKPDVLIDILNFVFTEFDVVCQRHSVEKIITIGDAYVAANLNSATREGDISDGTEASAAIATCMTAIEMQEVMNNVESLGIFYQLPGNTMKVRIGVHSGGAFGFVSGGSNKVKYELIGEAVEIAEQTQSLADPGSIYITSKTAELIKSMESSTFEMQSTGKHAGPEECISLRRRRTMQEMINQQNPKPMPTANPSPDGAQ